MCLLRRKGVCACGCGVQLAQPGAVCAAAASSGAHVGKHMLNVYMCLLCARMSQWFNRAHPEFCGIAWQVGRLCLEGLVQVALRQVEVSSAASCVHQFGSVQPAHQPTHGPSATAMLSKNKPGYAQQAVTGTSTQYSKHCSRHQSIEGPNTSFLHQHSLAIIPASEATHVSQLAVPLCCMAQWPLAVVRTVSHSVLTPFL
jgi:hypothetical protein